MIIVTKKTLSNVSLSKQKLIEACVQLVTINGRPFTLIEDSGFKMIIDPLLDAIGGGKHYFFFNFNFKQGLYNLSSFFTISISDVG